MAEKKPSQQITALVARRLAAGDYMELAVALGIVPRRALDSERRLDRDRSKARRVDNWLKGNDAPRFDQALEMLSLAGLLQPEAEAALRGITPSAAAQAVAAAREAAARREVLPRNAPEVATQDERRSA